VQVSTRPSVKLTHVDQGYTSLWAAEAARTHGIALQGLTLPEAKRCFVLLVKDGQHHASTLADLHLHLSHAQAGRSTAAPP
jgi:hypothetical protein